MSVASSPYAHRSGSLFASRRIDRLGDKKGRKHMRARAGDPPRTMPQKILAGRATDPQLRGDLVQVKVDQVILSRAPSRALAEALAFGVKKSPVEVAVAYAGRSVTDAPSLNRA